MIRWTGRRFFISWSGITWNEMFVAHVTIEKRKIAKARLRTNSPSVAIANLPFRNLAQTFKLKHNLSKNWLLRVQGILICTYVSMSFIKWKTIAEAEALLFLLYQSRIEEPLPATVFNLSSESQLPSSEQDKILVRLRSLFVILLEEIHYTNTCLWW